MSSVVRDLGLFLGLVKPVIVRRQDVIKRLGDDSFRQYHQHKAMAEEHVALAGMYHKQLERLRAEYVKACCEDQVS
jgi:hypothetical protein